MLSGKAANTNFIVFGLTRSALEPMIYRTPGELSTGTTYRAVNGTTYWAVKITTYRAVNRTSNRDVNRNDLSSCQQERLIELSTGTTYRAVNRTTYRAINRNDLSSCQQKRLVQGRDKEVRLVFTKNGENSF
jgi:hypothetical protein